MSLYKILKKNSDIFKSYRNILSRVSEMADYDNLVEEMESLHKQKKTRNLVTKKVTVHKLIEAEAQAANYRSRIVEIKTTTQKAQRILASIMDAVEAECVTKYARYIEERSIDGKKKAVKTLLQSGHEKLNDLTRIVDMADVYIEDIDQSGWMMKRMMDGLNIEITRESILGNASRRI